jgi:DNA-binding response OmpR family regulator
MAKRIISTSYNTTVLKLRNLIIERMGYQVTTSKDSSVVLDLIARNDFDGAVVGDSIPFDLRVALLRDIRKIAPALPIVALYRGNEDHGLRGLADQLVGSMEGLEALMSAIIRAVGPANSH